MLIEFRVGNYRSIKDPQTLSLVAAKNKDPVHTIKTGIKAIPAVVQSAVIYGPNASGKSNFLSAFSFMQWVVAHSATTMQLGQSFSMQPFRLDSVMSLEPSDFEIIFLENGIRYQYGFRLTAERIYEEWLFVFQTAKAQQWFHRKYNPTIKKDEYRFSTHLLGKRKTWQESTRPNALFLSTAVHLNSQQLSPVFNWIVQKMVIFTENLLPLPDYSTKMLQNEQEKSIIEKFLISADISITNISSVIRKGYTHMLGFNSTGQTSIQSEEIDRLLPQFHHQTKQGSAIFELHEESLGTQRLFSLAGPLLDILKLGRVFVMDELERSLHPHLVHRLVELFHNPLLNKKGAQLIFTTHNTSLLSHSLFQRDQIWFTEKTREQATTLYPLTDFSPRKDEALEKGYLIGRYGAVPFFEPWDYKEPKYGPR